MLILAIESSALAASAAIVTKEKTLAEITVNNKKTHSETLMPMVDFVFRAAQTDISGISYIAVTTGPGSFTGLRIGAATAKALAHGSGKQLIGVPTLDALAYNIFDESNLIIPIMDARRNQVYSCIYQRSGEKLNALTDYMAIGINELLETAESYGKGVVFLGDGISVYGDLILNTSKNFTLAPANNNMQRASSVALAAMSNPNPITYNNLKILYLRKPQAEREYEAGVRN
ncbi:MAG: tRNA (adenosine(37)-N6)-threonylcarbamoyltransferase complex dimerization subunit type 1 TsaB [Clostridiales bacterium]|jgi:tRNA threonylcarbamoyladenosine biosynthesis protein TsaB|nr:tRNA (adenosine(37)-N6)-threonylcarbamoyltransferase complex dimerization subunit type 1 TsaB [Clostridiales bacterium]